MPPAVFLKLISLHDAVPRYVQQVETPRGRIALTEGRTQAIEIEGCTFVKDKDAPALEIHYVNSEETSIEYLPQSDEDSALEGMREMGANVDLNDGYGVIPLGMKLYKLGKRSASANYTLQALPPPAQEHQARRQRQAPQLHDLRTMPSNVRKTIVDLDAFAAAVKTSP